MTRDELRAECRKKAESLGQQTSWLVCATKEAMARYLEPGNTVAVEQPPFHPGEPDDDVSRLTRQLAEAIAAKQKPAQPAIDHAAIDAAVARGVQSLRDEVKPLIDLAERAKTDSQTAARLPLIASAASAPGGIMDKLIARYQPGKPAPVHACLLSPPSFGKSFAVRKLGESYDLYIEHGCSGDMDEISTLCGTVAPDGKGGFTTVDGVLSQATRAASNGQNVLVLLDEVFRLREDSTNWLLTFLTPRTVAGVRTYQLRTRRPSANGTWEVIECPADRLHIVCAANLGHSRPNEAFWSRLDKVRIDANHSTLTQIASAVLSAYGISPGNPADVRAFAESFASRMLESRKLVASGQLAYPLDIRVLVRACETAERPELDSVRQRVKDSIVDACALWDGDLGDNVLASVDEASKLGDSL